MSTLRRVPGDVHAKTVRLRREFDAEYRRAGPNAALRQATLMVIGVTRRAGGYGAETVIDLRHGMDARGIVHNDVLVQADAATVDSRRVPPWV